MLLINTYLIKPDRCLPIHFDLVNTLFSPLLEYFRRIFMKQPVYRFSGTGSSRLRPSIIPLTVARPILRPSRPKILPAKKPADTPGMLGSARCQSLDVPCELARALGIAIVTPHSISFYVATGAFLYYFSFSISNTGI